MCYKLFIGGVKVGMNVALDICMMSLIITITVVLTVLTVIGLCGSNDDAVYRLPSQVDADKNKV